MLTGQRFAAGHGYMVVMPPLSDMALMEQSLCPEGEITRFITLWAPADSPVISDVARIAAESADVLFRIHCSAMTLSSVPKLPESSSGEALVAHAPGG